MTPETKAQCRVICEELARQGGAVTAYELRDALAARHGNRRWFTAETLQRRMRAMAAHDGSIEISERAGPNGAHCYRVSQP